MTTNVIIILQKFRIKILPKQVLWGPKHVFLHQNVYLANSNRQFLMIVAFQLIYKIWTNLIFFFVKADNILPTEHMQEDFTQIAEEFQMF